VVEKRPKNNFENDFIFMDFGGIKLKSFSKTDSESFQPGFEEPKTRPSDLTSD
jgi:hypothetical protein